MNERIAHILKSPWTIPTVVGLVSFGGGLGAGYFIGFRRGFNVNIDELMDYTEPEDGEGDDEFFDVEGVAEQRVIIDKEAYDSPATVPEMEVEVTADGRGIIVRPEGRNEPDPEDILKPEPEPEEEDEEDFEPVHVNVFEDPNWDWEEEVASRNLNDEGISDKPYILHHDEFHRQEMDYTQTTLAYYEGDDVLVPEGEQEPLFNHDELTGPRRWGHGSGDPNVVLIRNDARRAEYEILRYEGHFAKEVLGYEAEQRAQTKDLQHSRVGKFRDTD